MDHKLEKLKDKFIEYEIKTSKAISSGKKNSEVHRLSKIAADTAFKLRETEQGLVILLALLEHPDELIVGAAAAALLTKKPDVAVLVLERLKQRSGLVGANAQMALTTYKILPKLK